MRVFIIFGNRGGRFRTDKDLGIFESLNIYIKATGMRLRERDTEIVNE